MNYEKEQSLTSQTQNMISDNINIDDEINQLQGVQYDYLNNGYGNNGNNIYVENNPVLHGYKPRFGNHFNRSRMLLRPGSFVPGHMANDINEFERSLPLPFDRGGDVLNGNGSWDGNNNNDRRNYQNRNKYYDDYNHKMDFSKYPDLSRGYNLHGTNFNNLGSMRFDPIGNSHSQIDYGLPTKQH